MKKDYSTNYLLLTNLKKVYLLTNVKTIKIFTSAD